MQAALESGAVTRVRAVDRARRRTEQGLPDLLCFAPFTSLGRTPSWLRLSPTMGAPSSAGSIARYSVFMTAPATYHGLLTERVRRVRGGVSK